MDKKHVQGLLAEQLTAQKYRLDQYTKDELIEIYTALNHVQDDILRRWGKSIKTEWSQTRAVGMLEEARGLMDEIKPKIEGSIASTLGKISEESAAVYSDMLTFGGKAKAAKAAMLSAEQMAAYWRTTPVGGHLLNDWVNRTFDGPTIEAIRREVFAGMFQGEGYPKMIRRLQDGFAMTRREAETLVRTYVHTANIHAMEEVYGKNRDVIAGVRWLTAFDERTCMRCAALSGKLYPLDDHPPCPLHPRCRCVLVPETDIKKLKVQPRVAEDWAKGLKNKPPDLDKVVTPDGISRTDFRSWIMSRPENDQIAFFGKKRYALLKDGMIGWDDLFEESPGGVRLRLLEELQGNRETLDALLKKQADLDLARHKKMRDALDERAFNKAMRDAARASDLFGRGENARAKAIAGRALEKILLYTELLDKKYDFQGVSFETKAYMACQTYYWAGGTANKPIWKRGGNIELMDEEVNGWRPSKGIIDAIGKVYHGKSLTLYDRYYVQGLQHEIQHTRQNISSKIAFGLKKGDPISNMLETVNEWTSRRSYQYELLDRLGYGSVIIDDEIIMSGSYQHLIGRFDALLKQLGVDEVDLFAELKWINENQKVELFSEHVANTLAELSGASKIKGVPISEILQDIGNDNFMMRYLQ